MVLRSSLVINKYIFDSVALIYLIALIFLISILISILVSLLIFFILWLISFLYIYCCIAPYIAFCWCLFFSSSFGSSFGSSFDSSFVLILLINIKIYALCKGLYLRTTKLRLKALICFNNISFKAVLRISK